MAACDLLLAKVLAEPDDDRPRLEFADCLDAHKDKPRAEFIRLQCTLAKWHDCSGECLSPTPNGQPCEECEPCKAWFGREPELLHRETELLEEHGADWSEWLARMLVPSAVQFQTFGYQGGYNPLDRRQHRWTWRRGFIEALSCIWNDFAARADAIVATTPLRHVRLMSPPDVCVAAPMILDGQGKDGLFVRLVGRKHGMYTDSVRQPETSLNLLSAEWPHVRFEFPSGPSIPPLQNSTLGP
jgi:uncharacterized protein (TIGR02996 family)